MKTNTVTQKVGYTIVEKIADENKSRKFVRIEIQDDQNGEVSQEVFVLFDSKPNIGNGIKLRTIGGQAPIMFQCSGEGCPTGPIYAIARDKGSGFPNILVVEAF